MEMIISKQAAFFSFRCDTKNIGMTECCSFGGDIAYPAIWSYQVQRHCFLLYCLSDNWQVIQEYRAKYKDEELPEFIK